MLYQYRYSGYCSYSNKVSGKGLSPRSSLRLALPILAGTPRNAPTRLPPEVSPRATRASLRCFATIPARAVRCAPRRLGARALCRFRRFVARARPFPRIAPFAGCARDTSGLAARPLSPTRRFAHGLSPSLRFAPAQRTLQREQASEIDRASPPG